MRIITHPECLNHQVPQGHPERPDRLRAVLDGLANTGLLDELEQRQAAPIAPELLQRIHHPELLSALDALRPAQGLAHVDPDTTMGPRSLLAAALAAGAVADAARAVLADETRRAFCAVRPPGHHAEAEAAMGFCLYNSVALGAQTALDAGLDRVAILDFDVHHGNGTVDIFKDRPEVLVCSSFQHPFYPYRLTDIQRDNIVNTPLPAGTGGLAFRKAVERDWTPALERHRPELIFVSAGFDAHRLDPLAQLELDEEDFRWTTRFIADAARRFAEGRIVSALEGGYHLGALSASVQAHIEALAEG